MSSGKSAAILPQSSPSSRASQHVNLTGTPMSRATSSAYGTDASTVSAVVFCPRFVLLTIPVNGSAHAASISQSTSTVSSGVEFSDYQRAHDEILAQLRSVQLGDFEPWEIEGARSVLVNAVRTREDSGARLEENTIGQAATGIWESEEELIDALAAVTPERIAAAAQSMTLDTVYFLTGEEAQSHD